MANQLTHNPIRVETTAELLAYGKGLLVIATAKLVAAGDAATATFWNIANTAGAVTGTTGSIPTSGQYNLGSDFNYKWPSLVGLTVTVNSDPQVVTAQQGPLITVGSTASWGTGTANWSIAGLARELFQLKAAAGLTDDLNLTEDAFPLNGAYVVMTGTTPRLYIWLRERSKKADGERYGS